jgi:stearoyl-CoA desaturase (Delta-9 desaturase)
MIQSQPGSALRGATWGVQPGEPLRAVQIRVVIVHLACLAVFFVDVSAALVALAVLGYFVRVFAWEGGGHRYFAHRSFRTSRAFQFLLALLLAASGQRGPIWWAAHHRRHHRLSDREGDWHSPVRYGFWQAHLGWLLKQDSLNTPLDEARDLARYPELVWINRRHYLVPLLLLFLLFALGQYTSLFGEPGLGLAAMVWGFFIPTMLSLHASFVVNSLVHGGRPGRWHRRRFATRDASTNAWWLCIPTMGASWHNNHHRYMNSARAGFFSWELDLTYLSLRALALLGLVWDLQPVPSSVLEEGRETVWADLPDEAAVR